MSTDVINIEPPVKGVKIRKYRDLILATTKILAFLGPATFIIAGLGTKMGLWSWKFGLNVLSQKIGPVLLIACGIFALLSMLLSVIAPKKGFFVGAFAAIIPLVGMGQLAGVKNKVESLPLIHDITTDMEDVPVFTDTILSERAKTEGVNRIEYAGKLAPLHETDETGRALMKRITTLQAKAYPKVKPLILTTSPEVTFGQARAVVDKMGWKVKHEDASAGLIEATDSTFWYGFKDDIVIRIRPANDGGSRLDMRSISRVGTSDIGINAQRIRIFLYKMKEQS